jgi:hypothetical protein
MRFNLFDYPIASMVAEYFSPVTAWTGHTPFAFLVVQLLEPKTLVELGTHYGESYCAFCQAVAHLKLTTRCWAVDTWKGDKHTGRYGEDVLDFVRSYHDPHYKGFSELLQTTFDEAAPRFADGSIDLLHIDGSHEYEAVNHDYQTWRSKLSDRGVILIYDTCDKSQGFGVHKLWAELAGQYPSFEFRHNSGLGVLGVGKNLPQPFLDFLTEAREHPQQVCQTFSTLGRANEANCELLLDAYRAFEVQGEINQFKRQIGEIVDPESENFQAAMQNPTSYLFGMMNQMGAMIKRVGDLHRQLDAGKK